MPTEPKTLAARELHEWMSEGAELVLVDVLPRVSFDKQHLPGSVHASFYEPDFLERIEEAVASPRERVVVYCNSKSCNASARAARALLEAGYSEVYDFEGGVDEWRAEGFRVDGRAR